MEASESLYEGEVCHPDQPSTLELGEFDLDFIQLTYEFLRVGPDGDHIAICEDGYWFPIKEELLPNGWSRGSADHNGGIYSDVTIGVID